MSGRDEQPVTIPPPAGEDDAYNAATKVGAMPAEVMAKLRAEGLLPDEEPASSTRPAPAAGAPAPGIPRPAATPRVQIPSVSDSLPDMSDPEDTDEHTVLAASSPSHPLVHTPYGYSQPPPQYSQPPPQYSQPPPQPHYVPPAPVETPIAFGSGPGWSQPSGAPPSFPTHPQPSYIPSPMAFRESDAGVTQEVRAFGGKRSRPWIVAIVVVCLTALVALAFVMAVLSHRR